LFQQGGSKSREFNCEAGSSFTSALSRRLSARDQALENFLMRVVVFQLLKSGKKINECNRLLSTVNFRLARDSGMIDKVAEVS
jgi:hypothetical protein